MGERTDTTWVRDAARRTMINNGHGNRLYREITIPARAAALADMRRRVGEALSDARLSAEETEAIVIALNEACMNVIQHAYKGDSANPIKLSIECAPDAVHFELLDRAAPIDRSRVHGRPLADVRPGGLGVNFIRELMDEVAYTYPADGVGNCLRMTWRRRATEHPQR